MKITDHHLALYSKCPLLEVGELPLEYKAALPTLRWVLLSSACDVKLNKINITAKFEENLAKIWQNKEKTAQYWNSVRLGRRCISRIYKLYRLYKVIHPITTYSYTLNGSTVMGEYSVIEKRSDAGKPLILNVMYSRTRWSDKPQLDAIAKWLNAKNNFLDIGLYNFPLFKGKEWKTNNLFEPVASKWIYDILDQADRHISYPVPGSHCGSCRTKKCQEGLIQIGSNGHPWEG